MLYTERFAAEDVDLGFASPGVDEAALVPDLINALYHAAAEAGTDHAGAPVPVLAVFHVGITRVEGDGIRGNAVTRITGLLHELTSVTTAAAASGAALFVGITDGLFDDIRAECDFSEGWMPLHGAMDAKAWFRVY